MKSIKDLRGDLQSKMTTATPAPDNGAPINNGGSTEDSDETPSFLAAQPKEHGGSLYGLFKHANPTKIVATYPSDVRRQTWQQKVSMMCVKVLWRSFTVMKLVGFFTEWTLNFLVLNNGILGLIWKLMTFRWRRIIIPDSHADNYLSCIGHLDPRTELYVDKSAAGKAESTRADALIFPDENVGSRRTADVCIMAAKLAYENPAVINRIVTQCWNMHFVKFFNCWNEYQKMHNTQAFLFTDQPTDANAIVVAFRGTEGFNTYDWSTDFDFSWVDLQYLGKVHLGFLEALGLVTREDPSTFTKLRNNARRARARARPTTSLLQQTLEEIFQSTSAVSGLAEQVIHTRGRSLAFDDITREIAVLMHNNPNAKLFVTGHSLGGALATLYPVMLHYLGQTEMFDKIGAVYTFGQPRVGDKDFRQYASESLPGKYFRIVYCNDMVPRIPFDNDLMQFKHFGHCEYFNSVYDGLTLDEEPNPNYFGFRRMLTMHLNAAWEMFYAMSLISWRYGKEYSESWFSIMCRTVGLMVPGASGHSPTNYVNAVRLGPFPLQQRVQGDAVEFRIMAENVKDIAQAMTAEVMKIIGFPVPKLALKKV